jgi:hypothetical protein
VCAPLLGGQSRTAAKRGAIGVHQWKSIEGEAGEAEAQLSSARLVQLVADTGVSERFFVAGARADARCPLPDAGGAAGMGTRKACVWQLMSSTSAGTLATGIQ